MSDYIRVKGVSVLINLTGVKAVSLRKNYDLDNDCTTCSIVLIFYNDSSCAVVDDIESTADAEDIANSIINTLRDIRIQPA